MKNRIHIIFFLLVFSWGYSCSLGEYTVKILPLGDSITHANYEHYSYRYNLWKKLVDHNLDFDLVGSLDSNFGGNPDWPAYKGLNFDSDHDGHYGWRAEEILYGRSSTPEAGSLSDWLENYTPDIVLLHIGTNDIGASQSYTSTANEIKLIIDTIRVDNPDVTILLAKLIPRNWTYNNIVAFNEYIEPIAEEKTLPNSSVIVVDQWSGFDHEEDTYDGTHPNASGEEKMAEKWFEAMKSCLKDLDGNINLDDKVNSKDLVYISENWTDIFSADLYFGENFNDINLADTSSVTYIGNFHKNSFQPYGLELDKTYYWRVDEIDANGLHKGDVWQFTTGDDDCNIGFWKLDGKTLDLTNSNDGIAFGNPLINDPNWGRCFYFDGNSNYIEMPNEPVFDLTDEITISVWVNIDVEDEGYYTIASKGNSFWLYIDNYIKGIGFDCEGLGRPLQSSTDICDGKWHHITAVYDGLERAIYIDGIKDASRATTGAMVLNDSCVAVGNNESCLESNYFNGIIREFRIYSGRLSDAEILWLSKTDQYSPRPFNGQENVNCSSELIFMPKLWINNKPADINKDFIINFKDFAILAEDWLETIY